MEKVIESKTCKKCGKIKSIDNFTFRSDTFTYRNECKECEKKWKNKWYREYYTKYPEKQRQKALKTLYGLTHEDWLRMWDNQNGKCAICNNSFGSPSDACVDHNHESDKIRGLLCRQCNAALGLFKDDSEILNNAAKYLEAE